MDPGTAGTIGFLIRLGTMLAAAVVALRIARVDPRTLALGGAAAVVIVGLAAQQAPDSPRRQGGRLRGAPQT
jgi:small conductance mechanosensitive channel